MLRLENQDLAKNPLQNPFKTVQSNSSVESHLASYGLQSFFGNLEWFMVCYRNSTKLVVSAKLLNPEIQQKAGASPLKRKFLPWILWVPRAIQGQNLESVPLGPIFISGWDEFSKEVLNSGAVTCRPYYFIPTHSKDSLSQAERCVQTDRSQEQLFELREFTWKHG